MGLSLRDLFGTGGTMDRGRYALVGVLGFAIKHNLDRAVATWGFGRPWDVFNYWIPLRDVAGIRHLSTADGRFLGTMVALSLPFIWIGVVMTMKRLRAAGLPTSLVALFFAPFLNLLFFLILCIVPDRPRASDPARRSWLARVLPDSALGSAAVSLLITVPLGLGIALLGTQVLTNYGWGIFVALPFTMGFAATLIYEARQERSLGGAVGVACLSVSLLGAGFVLLAFEGAVCVLMAAPIALPLAAFGGFCAHAMQLQRWLKQDAPVVLSVLLLISPGVQLTERAMARQSPVFEVRSAIDIQAPPERVWQQVIAFSEISPPTELIFRAGVAYPIRAEIAGQGVGSERHCVFSTGAFVEPIQVWDEPRLLKFSVTENPDPMEEWTPYKHIRPPHLHGFLVSNGGQFLLTPLPNGGTRLEGTTWYQHGLWPAAYWKVWSDEIIHEIHMRVLRHIRDEVESGPGPRVGAR